MPQREEQSGAGHGLREDQQIQLVLTMVPGEQALVCSPRRSLQGGTLLERRDQHLSFPERAGQEKVVALGKYRPELCPEPPALGSARQRVR